MSWTSTYEAVEVGVHDVAPDDRRDGRRGGGEAGFDRRADGARGVATRTLASRVERVAAGLAARGFGAGDVLALWAPNLPPWAGVALGAMAAGGTVTGANPACTGRRACARSSPTPGRPCW